METTPELKTESATPESAPMTVPETNTPSPVTETAVASPVSEKVLWYKNTQLLVSLFIATLILLGAGYFVYDKQYGKGDVVAIVNGEKIYRSELNESIKLIEDTAKQQGVDVLSEENATAIRTQAIEVIVSNMLVITAANKSGIEITDADVEAKYAELVTEFGGEAALEAQIAAVGLTKEKLFDNIAERMLMDRYMEAETEIEDLTVTDEEIAEFLKGIDTTAGELPPLEQIRPQIEAQLIGQKQQTIINDLLTKLKSEGVIEMKI